MSNPRQVETIKKAGGIKVKPEGRAEAYQIGSKLIWLGCGNGKQVMLGYAHNPQQTGMILSLSAALKICNHD